MGGFGITDEDDLLLVTDFVTVRQTVTAVSVAFDDAAVSEFFDDQVDLGRQPEQFARIWCHSHPGNCPLPSNIDEETFQRVFGGCQWAIMFILAQDNQTYARLDFNVGPGGQILIPVEIDCGGEFQRDRVRKWDAEYKAHVTAEKIIYGHFDEYDDETIFGEKLHLPENILDEFRDMTPSERQYVLDELAQRPELWNEDMEVMRL